MEEPGHTICLEPRGPPRSHTVDYSVWSRCVGVDGRVGLWTCPTSTSASSDLVGGTRRRKRLAHLGYCMRATIAGDLHCFWMEVRVATKRPSTTRALRAEHPSVYIETTSTHRCTECQPWAIEGKAERDRQMYVGSTSHPSLTATSLFIRRTSHGDLLRKRGISPSHRARVSQLSSCDVRQKFPKQGTSSQRSRENTHSRLRLLTNLPRPSKARDVQSRC